MNYSDDKCIFCWSSYCVCNIKKEHNIKLKRSYSFPTDKYQMKDYLIYLREIPLIIDENYYENIIVDEIDRLNPDKCPVHSTKLNTNIKFILTNRNKKCIGCRIGLNEKYTK